MLLVMQKQSFKDVQSGTTVYRLFHNKSVPNMQNSCSLKSNFNLQHTYLRCHRLLVLYSIVTCSKKLKHTCLKLLFHNKFSVVPCSNDDFLPVAIDDSTK